MKFIKLLPNILTIIRFIFIPFIIMAITFDNYIVALVLFILSSASDVLDGYIARKFDAISDIGKLLDPLADKLTQLSVLLTLFIKSIIPIWIVAIYFIKDFVLVAGASFLYGKQLVVSSKWYGKLSTVLLFLAVVSSLIIKIYDIPFNFATYIYWLAIIFGIFALLGYIEHFYKRGYLPKKEDLKKNSSSKQSKDKNEKQKTEK